MSTNHLVTINSIKIYRRDIIIPPLDIVTWKVRATSCLSHSTDHDNPRRLALAEITRRRDRDSLAHQEDSRKEVSIENVGRKATGKDKGAISRGFTRAEL